MSIEEQMRGEVADLIIRIDAHLRQLAPHMRERLTVTLLEEARKKVLQLRGLCLLQKENQHDHI